MDKPKARKILVLEARVHKHMDYDAELFKLKLENKNPNLDDEVHEAFELIKDELVHILACVWGWER